jgi:small subunit ribosomal protein S21
MPRRGITVQVNDNFEKAMRKFKKKVQDSGKLLDLRNKQNYTKPTTARKLKANAARNRWRKYIESQQLPKQNF